MTRSFDDALRWADDGTEMFLDAVAGLDQAARQEPSLLPGWTRKHVVAHVAANADALGNLVRWAATGERTPMYATPEERAAGIERGLRMPAGELDAWLRRSATALAGASAALTGEQWSAEVVTAQGRTVPATEVPWLRAREVCVHTVDLGLGVAFADLPADFLEALCVEVAAKRGDVPAVEGPLAERAAWLTGRPHRLVGAPDLGAWL
ncbi:maleylpyruvate isomerase family mycothiol-dependent enzyme [Nonomuraea sp. MG754425]|uniref:maleylpyruvate isomerase family mycothiol-dependent enzyme n=1 Tax=Nonomuraea sp. MG754425 TaxID=2570319 RepID=UPI001EFFE47E|nr:maleylpyruvate isomerase family mycothiol-dependent enzyme [Nonomuraea sp. MG754425]MCF6467772.1 maleylpyruvate isomerase family mycothiol-dependent enzyme [Nonomuraea sp. MG754425]